MATLVYVLVPSHHVGYMGCAGVWQKVTVSVVRVCLASVARSKLRMARFGVSNTLSLYPSAIPLFADHSTKPFPCKADVPFVASCQGPQIR